MKKIKKILSIVVLLLLTGFASAEGRVKIGSYEYVEGHPCTVFGEYKGEYVNIDGLSRVESILPIQFRVFWSPDSEKFSPSELVRLAVRNYAIVYIYDDKGKHISTYKNAGSFIYVEHYFDLDEYLERMIRE